MTNIWSVLVVVARGLKAQPIRLLGFGLCVLYLVGLAVGLSWIRLGLGEIAIFMLSEAAVLTHVLIRNRDAGRRVRQGKDHIRWKAGGRGREEQGDRGG